MVKKDLRGCRVLVTGATGLVGGHLTERLVQMGAKVYITCQASDPLSYFSGNGLGGKVVTTICDIKDFERVFEIVSRYEIEYIFHLAAQAIVHTAFVNPLETLDTNIIGTVHILEAARRSAFVKGVVVASSDKAYGKKCDDATEDMPMAGDHPYDVSKSCTDLIARTYAKTYDLPVAVSRFGNIYGPGDMNFNRIIPGIMRAIVKDETLEIRSDGKFIRDYVYVKDVVDGYITLMEQMSVARGEAFNFSAGYKYSVIKLISTVGAILDTKVKFRIVDVQRNEIPAQSLNHEKAERRLGWKPQTTFRESIVTTADWYRHHFR